MKKETAIEFSNRVFGFHILAELDEMRNTFCPSKGSLRCSVKCPIYEAFIIKGYSCNEALDRYPEKCIQMMKENKKEYDSNDK